MPRRGANPSLCCKHRVGRPRLKKRMFKTAAERSLCRSFNILSQSRISWLARYCKDEVTFHGLICCLGSNLRSRGRTVEVVCCYSEIRSSLNPDGSSLFSGGRLLHRKSSEFTGSASQPQKTRFDANITPSSKSSPLPFDRVIPRESNSAAIAYNNTIIAMKVDAMLELVDSIHRFSITAAYSNAFMIIPHGTSPVTFCASWNGLVV